jgi:DNA-binding MarR family transcriptional regulator
MIMNNSSEDVVGAALELHRIMRSRMSNLVEGGVNLMQLHALMGLHEHPKMTMKEFAAMLHISSPSATAFVARLSKLGLLQRLHDAKNHKLVRLRVTPKGETRLRSFGMRRNKILGEVFSVIPPKDRNTFVRILRHIVASHSSSSL